MRKQFTLIAFNIVTALAAYAGVTLSPETANEYAEALVGFGGFIWILGNALIIKWRAKPAEAASTTTTTTTALLIALMVATLGLSACATRVAETPGQKVFAITTDFQSAALLVLAYVESPEAKPEIKSVLRKLYVAADDALVAAQTAVRQGDSPTLPVLISAATSAVDELFAYLVLAGIAGPAPPPKAVSVWLNDFIRPEARHAYQ